MQGWWCRNKVLCVAIGEESSWAQGKRPCSAAVQRWRLSHVWVWVKQGGFLALLVLVGHFSVPRLNAVLLHGEGPVDLEQQWNQFLSFYFGWINANLYRFFLTMSLLEMTHIVQFKVESTGVTHRLSISVTSPQSCRARVTVGTKCSRSFADNLQNRIIVFQLL